MNIAKTSAFDQHYHQYDDWFIENETVFLSELNAIRPFIPDRKDGLGICVGTGRFAEPLGITTGLEPSTAMRKFYDDIS